MQGGNGEIFIIQARRCKRCGGLLTSAEALKDGYGHVCRMKTREEELQKKRPTRIKSICLKVWRLSNGESKDRAV